MEFSALKSIRDYEVCQILPLVHHNASVLEIGAGAGWQSQKLHEYGAVVRAIDVEQNSFLNSMIFPVTIYDGENIPFPSGSFDIVFSSNTLEHIAKVEEFLFEIQRVLRPDGIAIHIVPSATWRWWTTLCYHSMLLKRLLMASRRRLGFWHSSRKIVHIPLQTERNTEVETNKIIGWLKLLVPQRHGERGNLITEVFLFSRRAWTKLFCNSGWSIVSVSPNRLFYEGNMIMGGMLSLRTRHLLSYVLGSACHIFVVKKRDLSNSG